MATPRAGARRGPAAAGATGQGRSWPGCEDVCDHLGVTYALLQAQRHAGSAALAQAIALAMGHVEQRLQPLPGDCLPGALAMLVLARHLRNSFVLGPGADSQARARIPALMDPLAESLLSTAAASASATKAEAAAHADASRSGQPLLSWAELAMHAYASSRPPTSDSPTLRAARSACPRRPSCPPPSCRPRCRRCCACPTAPMTALAGRPTTPALAG
ncbi:hypothetical protein ACHFCA_24670 [Delftia tsuruhatensis]